MAGAAGDGLENSIIKFVHSRTGETVYLDLSQEHHVILRPFHSRGSLAIGAFWVKLLQHANNYPTYTYPYKELYRAGRKFQLHLHVDGYLITIDLTSGQMIIKGQHVIDWFIRKFPEIMRRYEKPIQSVSHKLNGPYGKEDLLQLQYEKEEIYKNHFEKWPLNVVKSDVYVMDAGRERPAIFFS